MSNRIEARFQLGGRVKHFSATKNTKVSELIEKLKSIYKDENINIELFYGGRFLNPNFTLEQIKYNKNIPINVFTSSDEYKAQYDNLSTTQIITTSSTFDDSDILRKSAVFSNLDGEDIHLEKIAKFKKDMSKSDYEALHNQALKNNVDDYVMLLLYQKKLNKDLSKTIIFFNEESIYENEE